MINPEMTEFFGTGEALGGVFPTFPCKIRFRQPTALKFARLTVDVMNYKIC